MARPENYSDGQRMKSMQARMDELEKLGAALSAEWEAAATEIESYKDMES